MIGEIPGLCTYLDIKRPKQCHPVTRIRSSPYPILFATAPPSCRPECTSCTTNSPASTSSTRNYTRYIHASVIFIVLYPSCTHTHHIPTHLRLSFGLHGAECLHAFRHYTFPFLPKISFMQVHKKLPPSHLYDNALWTTRILTRLVRTFLDG